MPGSGDPPWDSGIVACPSVDASAVPTPTIEVSDAAIPSNPSGGVVIPDGTYVLSSITGCGVALHALETLAVQDRSVFDLHGGQMRETFASPFRQSMSGSYSNETGSTVIQLDCPQPEAFQPPVVLTSRGFDFVIIVNHGTGAIVEGYSRQ